MNAAIIHISNMMKIKHCESQFVIELTHSHASLNSFESAHEAT